MLTAALLRHQWRDLLATLVALTLGAAVCAAALAVAASARPRVPAQYAAADVLVRAPAAGQDTDAFPEYLPWDAATADTLAARLRALPGVRAVVPVRTFSVRLVLDSRAAPDPDRTDAQGRGWGVAALAPDPLSAGRPPRNPGEVVVGEGRHVGVGDRVRLVTVAGPREATVTGLVRGAGLYVADAWARTLGGGTTLLAATTVPGTDVAALASTVRTVLGPGPAVLTGDDRAGAEPEGDARTRGLGAQVLGMMLTLACFAAVLVVAQTFALAAVHRRPDTALLRALGATPRQVRAVLLGQAAAGGLVGAVLGGVLGTAAAPALGRLLVRTGLEPAGFEVRTDVSLLGLLLVAGPLVAVPATWATGRRASRVSPLEAVRTARVEDRRLGGLRRTAGGLVTLGAAAAGVAAALAGPRRISGLATLATLLAVTAVTLLAPLVLPPLVRVCTWPIGLARGATGMIVRGSMTAATARTTATMVPVIVTTAIATLVLGYVETGRAAYGGADVPAGTSAVVAPRDAPGLTEDVVERVRAVATGAVDDALPSQVFTGRDHALAATEAVGVRSVPAGTALVNQALAARDAVTPGAVLPVVLPDGERVAVRITQVRDGGDDPRIILPRDLLRAHDASALTPRILVTGTAPERLAPVTGPSGLALAADAYVRSAGAEEYRLLRVLVLTSLGLALAYTLLSIATTLLMATAARVRDLGLLRRSGATVRQVRSALAWEAVVVVAIGSGLGLLAGLVGLLGIRAGLAQEVGRGVPVTLPWDVLGLLVATSAALAVVASLWSAGRIADSRETSS